jgi:hypothetical protein
MGDPPEGDVRPRSCLVATSREGHHPDIQSTPEVAIRSEEVMGIRVAGALDREFVITRPMAIPAELVQTRNPGRSTGIAGPQWILAGRSTRLAAGWLDSYEDCYRRVPNGARRAQTRRLPIRVGVSGLRAS